MACTEKNTKTITIAKALTNTPWCDDYEKMISGMMFVKLLHFSTYLPADEESRYDSFVPELVAGRLRARKLVKKFNEYLPDDATDESLAEGQTAMLKELIGHVGKRVAIDPPFRVDYGSNIIIGNDFYANFNLVILDCALVTIGDRTKFGPGVSIYAATHPTAVQERRDFPDYSKEVNIGNDCWIGGNTVILPGVTIGNGTTVGAGSVVTQDIPSFSIAVGSPARVIKKVKPESACS